MTDYTDKLEKQLELSREKEKYLTSELSAMNDSYSCLGNTVEKLGLDLMAMADDVSRLELDRSHYESQVENLEDALVDTHQAAKSQEAFLKERLLRSMSELYTTLEHLAIAEAKLSKLIMTLSVNVAMD